MFNRTNTNANTLNIAKLETECSHACQPGKPLLFSVLSDSDTEESRWDIQELMGACRKLEREHPFLFSTEDLTQCSPDQNKILFKKDENLLQLPESSNEDSRMNISNLSSLHEQSDGSLCCQMSVKEFRKERLQKTELCQSRSNAKKPMKKSFSKLETIEIDFDDSSVTLRK